MLLWSVLLVLSATVGTFAQYKGSPVKKDKLISVLRSKQLQTREIVTVVKSNGVDFQVTPEVETELVGAGARAEVIAVAKANGEASGSQALDLQLNVDGAYAASLPITSLIGGPVPANQWRLVSWDLGGAGLTGRSISEIILFATADAGRYSIDNIRFVR